MHIAVSADSMHGLDAAVSQHFGRCPFYALVDVADGRVVAARSIANPYAGQHAPGVVPRFIHAQGADVILTGGMGRRAVGYFDDLGIAPVTGASGTVRAAVDAYLAGQLSGSAPCHESSHDCGDGPGHHQPAGA